MHRVTVPARAGVAGNPSDAYGGAAVAVPVAALTATVEVVDAEVVRVVGPDETWPDVGALVDGTARYGHEGGNRLVTAAIATLAAHVDMRDDAFEVRWSTDIPRSVGLAGSSAVVVATMQSLAQRWSVTIEPVQLARLALQAEVHSLGIAAGLMDRAVQAVGGPVLVDGDDVRALDGALPPLLVAWRATAAGPSQRVHGPLRDRFEAREPEVLSAMDRLATYGRGAAKAIELGDRAVLAECMRATWRERVGLGIVADDVVAMVDALDAVSVPATSAGSGGAVVGLLDKRNADEAKQALDGLADGSVLVGEPASEGESSEQLHGAG